MSLQSEAFELGDFTVTIALDAGPRILGFSRTGGPGLFATLPDAVLESAAGRYSLLGGHRLWRAPEIPAVTYEPDDRPVALARIDDGVRLVGGEDRNGITKAIEVRGSTEGAVVDHELANEGDGTVTAAAWAITQLAPGGVAVVPQSPEPADDDGVQPNRSIVLWPYTDPAAPELRFDADEIRVRASDSEQRTKIGTANRLGWVAYALGDSAFVKWAPLHDDTMDYADLGASVQCYRDHRFLELETLSPLTDLAPGETLRHREVWRIYDLDAQPLDELLASLPKQPPEGVE